MNDELNYYKNLLEQLETLRETYDEQMNSVSEKINTSRNILVDIIKPFAGEWVVEIGPLYTAQCDNLRLVFKPDLFDDDGNKDKDLERVEKLKLIFDEHFHFIDVYFGNNVRFCCDDGDYFLTIPSEIFVEYAKKHGIILNCQHIDCEVEGIKKILGLLESIQKLKISVE